MGASGRCGSQGFEKDAGMSPCVPALSDSQRGGRRSARGRKPRCPQGGEECHRRRPRPNSHHHPFLRSPHHGGQCQGMDSRVHAFGRLRHGRKFVHADDFPRADTCQHQRPHEGGELRLRLRPRPHPARLGRNRQDFIEGRQHLRRRPQGNGRLPQFLPRYRHRGRQDEAIRRTEYAATTQTRLYRARD